MTRAYRCPVFGPDFCEGTLGSCPHCGGSHETWECGLPDVTEGAPAVHGARIPKYYDWAAGCWINDKADKRHVYERKGLVDKSIAEHKRQHPDTFQGPKGTITSYAGKCNSTPADATVVRTGTGQRVV